MDRSDFGVYKHLVLNILIALIISGVYYLSNHDDAVSVMGMANTAPIYRGVSDGTVGIQCAVDWNAESIEKILDILDENDVDITFLISGEWAESNCATAIRMHNDGHEIGILGMNPTEDGNLSWVEKDISSAVETVIQACAADPRLYYPSGRNLEVSVVAAERVGLKVVMCTVDLLCARGGKKEITERALENVANGSIIMLQPTAALTEALPELIEIFYRKGLEPVTTSEALTVRQ